jgi:iron complex outermembrane receptor protein
MTIRATFQGSAVLAALLSAASLSAQGTKPDSVVRLPDVVRSVSRHRTTIWSQPASMATEQVDDALRASTRLDEALSGIPGVLAQSRSGGMDLRITIRGFGSRGAGDRSNAGTMRGIRVLIDGFPETEPDGRTSLDLVDLGTASHIDVLRSNASASWGNAAGGVIAVSTRPEANTGQTNAMASAGSFGFRRALTSGAVPLGNSLLYGSLTRTLSDGWRANSGGERTLVNAAWVSPEDRRTTLGVYAVGTRNQFSIPGPLTADQVAANPQQANATYLARRERRDNTIGRLGSTLTHRFTDALAVSTSAFVTDKHLERSERGTYRFFDRTHRGGSVLAERNFGKAGTLMAGGDFALQDGPARFWSLTAAGGQGTTLQQDKNEWARNLGVFVEHDAAVGSRLNVALGFRWDAIDYRYFDYITPKLNAQKTFQRVTPKLGATFKLAPTHVVFASLGGGVEAPAGNETDPPGTFGQDTITGLNPLLNPIRSTTLEMGLRRVIAPAKGAIHIISYDVALYQTNVRDEIVPYRGGRFYFTAGKARRRGLEASTIVTVAGGLEVGGSLTLQDHRYIDYIVDSVHYGRPGHLADYSGNQVVGSPKSYMGADVHWNPLFSRTVRLSAGVQTIGTYFADDANTVEVPRSTLFSAGLAMREPLSIGGGLGLRGAITVNNLFNRKHIASAFLNPDLVGGKPAAFEPGLPRYAIVSVTVDWMTSRDE